MLELATKFKPDVDGPFQAAVDAGLRAAELWTGPEVLDRYAFALLICKEFDLNASGLTANATAALAQKAARPLDGGLKVARAQAQLKTRLRSPAEGLHAMREFLEYGGPRV